MLLVLQGIVNLLHIYTAHYRSSITYLPNLEDVGFLLLPDVLHDEGVESRVGTRDEGMIVPDIADLSNPVTVQLAHDLHRHQGGVVT